MEHNEITSIEPQDREALDIRTSDDDEQPQFIPSSPWKREANLMIKSTKMPPLWKIRLGVLLDLVRDDLTKVNCQKMKDHNLDPDERRALREQTEAPNLVIKKSDKGGNVGLLSAEYYEKEIKRQVSDTLMRN